ncbi:MAG TPA: hypothetical protein VJH94_04005 [Candidatus Paceibacterota bacterium]
MQHYVCTGDCAGESEKPKVCETEGCSKEGQPLSECDCDDGIHKGIAVTSDEPDIESMDDEDVL